MSLHDSIHQFGTTSNFRRFLAPDRQIADFSRSSALRTGSFSEARGGRFPSVVGLDPCHMQDRIRDRTSAAYRPEEDMAQLQPYRARHEVHMVHSPEYNPMRQTATQWPR